MWITCSKFLQMRIKKGFVLRPTLGYTLVIATGELASRFNGMIKLNSTSADIWRWIDGGLEREAVIARFMQTYDVDEATAARDVDATIANMREAQVFEEA